MGRRRGTRRPEVEEAKIQALRLWMTGATYRAIGQQLGVSHQTAYKRVQAALDDMRPHAQYSQYRAVQLAELEVARRGLRRVIAAFGTTVSPWTFDEFIAALGSLYKLQEREAKLLGLDRVPTPADELAGLSDDELEAVVAAWTAEQTDA